MLKIHWSNQGEGSWRSGEGRFRITPRYRHTVNPDSYQVTDYMAGRNQLDGHAVYMFKDVNFDTVRDCKDWAIRQLEKESEVRQ